MEIWKEKIYIKNVKISILFIDFLAAKCLNSICLFIEWVQMWLVLT